MMTEDAGDSPLAAEVATMDAALVVPAAQAVVEEGDEAGTCNKEASFTWTKPAQGRNGPSTLRQSFQNKAYHMISCDIGS